MSTVRDDRLVQLTFSALAVTAALYLLPLLDQAQRALLSRTIGPLVFLSLVVAALLAGLDRLGAEEKRFWLDLAAAFGAWWIVAVLFVAYPHPERPLAVDLAIETLYAAYYLSFVLAAERRPHHGHAWRATGLERALAWPAVTVFVLGLFSYFILIPLVVDGRASDRSSYALYLTLDATLTARFAFLAIAAGTARWRTLYLVVAATAGAVFSGDLLELSAYAGATVEWGATLDLAYYLPYLLIVLARARHVPFPRAPAQESDLATPPFSGPATRTLLYALALPVIHYGLSTFGFLQAARAEREAMVFWLLLLLGLIAVIQQRLFVRKTRELWRDRERLEASLRSSEKDLRVMVERYHSDQRLRVSEEKFAKALAASADVIALSAAADGRIVDVNDSFVAVTGYPREELLGRTSAEIDLWADPEDRDHMVRTLELDGTVRGLESRFRTKSGELVAGVLSAERLTIDGEAYLLTVTHIVEDLQPEPRETAPRAGHAAPGNRQPR